MATPQHSVLTFLHLIIFVSSQSDICFWGRKEDSTTHVNGLYTSTTSGGIYYYEKIDNECSDNNLFMYTTASQWYIGATLGDNINFIATCNSDSYVETPQDCGDNWEFSGVFDASISIYEGECPLLEECDEIHITYTSNMFCDECCGIYLSYPDVDNAFVREDDISGTSTYFYFSATDVGWMCSVSEEDIKIGGECQNITESDSIIGYQLDQDWFTLQPLQWEEFSWSSSNESAYMNCLTVSITSTETATAITRTEITSTQCVNGGCDDDSAASNIYHFIAVFVSFAMGFYEFFI